MLHPGKITGVRNDINAGKAPQGGTYAPLERAGFALGRIDPAGRSPAVVPGVNPAGRSGTGWGQVPIPIPEPDRNGTGPRESTLIFTNFLCKVDFGG